MKLHKFEYSCLALGKNKIIYLYDPTHEFAFAYINKENDCILEKGAILKRMNNLILGKKDKPEFEHEKLEYSGKVELPIKKVFDTFSTWIGYENLREKEKKTKGDFDKKVKSLIDMI